MAYPVRNRIRVVFWAAALFIVVPQLAFAQYGQTPGDLLDTFRSLRPNWFTAAVGAANRLFGLLALIEFAWTAVLLVLDKADLQGWTAALIRRMMFVGAFLALLVNGPLWIPAIIDSFATLGQNVWPALPERVFPLETYLSEDCRSPVTWVSQPARRGFSRTPAVQSLLCLRQSWHFSPLSWSRFTSSWPWSKATW